MDRKEGGGDELGEGKGGRADDKTTNLPNPIVPHMSN